MQPMNSQMMMYNGPNGQQLQLVPVKSNATGQLVPFEQKEKEKKWSLTEWEDKRMRHTSGRICVHVMYCIATLLLIITFIAMFTDIWKTYQRLLENKRTEIAHA